MGKLVQIRPDDPDCYWPRREPVWKYRVACLCKPGCRLPHRGGFGLPSAAACVEAIRRTRREAVPNG